MVGIYGTGGIAEAAPATPSGAATRKSPPAAQAPHDDVDLSQEARNAASAARSLQDSQQEARLQAERIARARERIEQGTYRLQGVVQLVAARICRFIPDSPGA